MSEFDPRVDDYIQKSADFAKPILEHIRSIVHEACPGVTETIKWSFPHFDYKGTICSVASFKQHCAFSFPKAALMKDANKLLVPMGESAMGHFGRITSLKDLPSDKILKGYIQEAIRINEEGLKVPKAKTAKVVPTPPILLEAINKNKKAKMHFEEFSPSSRNEYAEWINEAKTEATKNKRVETAVEWIAEGKKRNWKYER